MDHLSPKRRSWLMSRVKSKDSAAEMRVRQLAHSLGLRFRLHQRKLPATPDLVFPKYHVAIFVHGCFWHRHRGCKKATTPKSRVEYWQEKFRTNVARDQQAILELQSMGWRTVIIWECETKDEGAILHRLNEVFGQELI